MAAETAARLTVGEVMSNFTYDTPFATGLTLSDTVQKTPKTALLFLRYYGCTLCQYDIHQLAENYHQITDVGGQVIVVLQSDPAGLAQELQPDTFPFSILCDPRKGNFLRLLQLCKQSVVTVNIIDQYCLEGQFFLLLNREPLIKAL